MAKALIITEKPSVARDIVAALGGFVPRAGNAYWESERYLCTFAVGHVLELLEPQDIDPAYQSWRLDQLPILPGEFKLKPVQGQEKRIDVIRQLAERDDVRSLINACDAAREGELIFREIVQYLGCRKWVQRLWLQSMTHEAIRAGFERLRDGTDLDGLGSAAECRARSDWLIGMNATRAFSLRLRGREERKPWSVGRVQTPTLKLLVDRELEILGHVPKAYWKLVATFAAEDHEYEGTWFDPRFKADDAKPELKDDRVFAKDAAEALAAKVEGRPATASETREESLRHAPYLFNLTGLQKYMSTRYKWTAKRTLEAAQRCYEQHKVLTYPRTNSSALPSDYRAEVQRLIEGLAGHPVYGPSAQYLLKNGRKNEKRTFDDAAVDDHFAIIPTGKTRALSGDDEKVYDAVVRRFLATFHPAAIYDKVKRVTVVAGESFRTGPIETLAVPGWLAVYDRQGEERPEKLLPALKKGQKAAKDVPVSLEGTRLEEHQTKPPPRITEAGLLGLMENAGRRVDDEQLASALMSAEGLGTAATRADIIQNLKAKEYVDETLRPTFKGIHLIVTLERIKAQRLTSPELTARLELELGEVEKGKRTARAFMGEIERYASEVVEVAKRFDFTKVYPDAEPLGTCPVCKQRKVYERARGYDCACGFAVPKDLAGRYVERNSATLLVRDGETPPLEGFRTRGGKDVRARLVLAGGRGLRVVTEDGSDLADAAPAAAPERAGATRYPPRGDGRSRYPARGDDRRQAAGSTGSDERARRFGAADGRGAYAPAPGDRRADAPPPERRILGPCLIHGGGCTVVETRNAYMCETRLKAFRDDKRDEPGVSLPKVVCQRELLPDEVEAYLKTGETADLGGFVSKAGRPFIAKLKMTPSGSFAFVFPDRGPAAREGDGKRVNYPPRGTARRPHRKNEASSP